MIDVILAAGGPGSSFLPSQLDSLNRQSNADWRIFALANGAVDEALISLRSLPAHRLGRISIEHALLGLPAAFCKAASMTHGSKAEYFAFMDQDDVWYPTKLSVAKDALDKADGPTLWICNYRIIAKNGQRTLARIAPPDFSPGNVLIENAAPGCSMVWNRELHDLLLEAMKHSGVAMHDWLALGLAASAGTILWSSEPLMDYRLHSAQAVGIDRRISSRAKRFIASMRGPNAITQSVVIRRVVKVPSRPLSVMASSNPIMILEGFAAGVLYRMNRVESLWVSAALALQAGINRFGGETFSENIGKGS